MSSSHYATLGVSNSADVAEIKRAYRKLSLATHPDKTKSDSGEEFAKISEAYHVLSDPEKRREYDNPPLIDVDLFADLFRGRQWKTNTNINHPSPVAPSHSVHRVKFSLEDFYAGKTCKIAISRKVRCRGCQGEGGKSRREVSCLGCGGRGVRVSGRGGGYGTVSMQTCIQCRGVGTRVAFEETCSVCTSMGVVRERAVVEAKFEPGAHPGDRVILKEMGDYEPGRPVGDVIVVVIGKSHPTFERNKDILRCRINISLKQSLCGFSLNVTHLDGREIEIHSASEVVTPPGHKFVVPGEGIPRGHGHLEITVGVDFSTIKKNIPAPVSRRLAECLDVISL
jgi:DnaJ family protein A protein 2